MTTTPDTLTNVPALDMPADAAQVAMDWLKCKDIEAKAKLAEKARKAAGLVLLDMIGRDGTVTVNRGGFRTYALKVADCKGRPSGDRALLALVADGILTQEQAATYLEASRGDDYQTIALKPVKA